MAGYIGSKAVNLSTTGADINGDANIDGDLSFRDNDKIKLGAGSDLQIYHDGANSYITDTGTGDLIIDSNGNAIRLKGTNGENMIVADTDASAKLFYNGSEKLATTATGIDVTGTVTADGLTGDSLLPLSITAASGRAMNFYANGGTLAAKVASTGDISFYDSLGSSQSFFWDASAESLGIGTSSVQSNVKMQIVGADGASGASANVAANELFVDNDGNTGMTIGSANTGTGYYAFADSDVALRGGLFYDHSSDDMGFRVASGTAMTLDSSGNLGIGTSSPSSILHVSSSDPEFILTDTSTNVDHSLDGNSGTGVLRLHVDKNSEGSDPSFIINMAGSEAMRIDSSGSVGIGTSSPSSQDTSANNLVIDDTAGNGGLTIKTPATSIGAIHFSDGTSGADRYRGIISYSHSENSMRFHTDTARAMTIDSSGNLLVGTTNSLPADNSVEGIALSPQYNGGIIQVSRTGQAGLTVNRRTSDGDIALFKKDGITVGSIGSKVGDIYMGNGQNIGLMFEQTGADRIEPCFGTTGAPRDNAIDLGGSSSRFDDIYATNGTIQTSDRNEKQDIAELSDAEQRVAVAAKGLMRKFRWRDAVAEKGDDARTHFGIIAQDLQAAFAAEGLDAGDYAMFISSTWTDEETGEERTRMGVRYSELLAFIIGAL